MEVERLIITVGGEDAISGNGKTTSTRAGKATLAGNKVANSSGVGKAIFTGKKDSSEFRGSMS